MAIYQVSNVNDLFKYVNGYNGGPRARVGDRVNIDAGTYLCNQSGTLNFQYGVEYVGAGINSTIIQSISNHGAPNVIASGTMSDWINNTTLFSGMTFNLRDSAGNASPYANALFVVDDARVIMKSCMIHGPGSGSDKNAIAIYNTSGSRCFFEFYDGIMCSGGADLFSTYGYQGGVTREHADTQLSRADIYNSILHSAGQDGSPATNNQTVTGHQGFPVRLNGCQVYNGWIDGPTCVTMEYCIHEPYVIIGSGIAIQENGGFNVQVGNIIRHVRNEMSNNDGDIYYSSVGHRRPRSAAVFKNNIVEKLSSNAMFLVQGHSGSAGNYLTQTNMLIQGNHFRQPVAKGGGAEAFIQLSTPVSGQPTIDIVNNHFDGCARLIRFNNNNSGDYNGFGGARITLVNNSTMNMGGHFSYKSIKVRNYNLATILINNAFASGTNLFDDTVSAPNWSSEVYGTMQAYGNVMTPAIQTGWPGPSGEAVGNYFGATPGWSITTIRTPTQGGNLDYGGSGLAVLETKSFDITRKLPFQMDYVGANSRPITTGILVPSQY